jgi:hypothetical protein
MHRDALTAWLRQPHVKATLVPGFRGPCSISAMAHPQRPGQVAIRVRVPRNVEVRSVPAVLIEDETVEVFLDYTYLPLKSHLCS